MQGGQKKLVSDRRRKTQNGGNGLMKKYVVVDYYEGSVDVVGKADTLKEAREIEKDWHEETDGECMTEIIIVER